MKNLKEAEELVADTIMNPKFQKIVDRQIKRAEKEIKKAEKELKKRRSDKSIMRLSISWLHSQLAIKLANLKIYNP